MSLSYGWNWDGLSWRYLSVPVDIWSPFHEQGNAEHARDRHEEMGRTAGGRALDVFFVHVKGCADCVSFERLCSVGARQWEQLESRWRVWCLQLEEAQFQGKRMREMYSADRRCRA